MSNLTDIVEKQNNTTISIEKPNFNKNSYGECEETENKNLISNDIENSNNDVNDIEQKNMEKNEMKDQNIINDPQKLQIHLDNNHQPIYDDVELNDDNNENVNINLDIATHMNEINNVNTNNLNVVVPPLSNVAINDEKKNSGVNGLEDNEHLVKNKIEQMQNNGFSSNIVNCQQATFSKRSNLLCLMYSIVLWIFFIGAWTSYSFPVIIVFVILYFLYYLECFSSSNWRYIQYFYKPQRPQSIQILNEMISSPIIICWHVESYHYENVFKKITNNDSRTDIIWLYGQLQNGNELMKAGYVVHCFQSEWLLLNYLNHLLSQDNIKGFVLPNYDNVLNNAQRLEKAIYDAWQLRMNYIYNNVQKNKTKATTQMKFETPTILHWTGNIDDLIQECLNKQILKKERRKVITHIANTQYQYERCCDVSSSLPKFQRQITKVYISKAYKLGDDATKCDYESKKKKFCEENNKDMFQFFEEKSHIKGFEKKIIVRLNDIENCRSPWYLTSFGYWSFSFFMFTIIPRIALSMNTKLATFNIIKKIYLQ